jgi:hypothetical protein
VSPDCPFGWRSAKSGSTARRQIAAVIIEAANEQAVGAAAGRLDHAHGGIVEAVDEDIRQKISSTPQMQPSRRKICVG